MISKRRRSDHAVVGYHKREYNLTFKYRTSPPPAPTQRLQPWCCTYCEEEWCYRTTFPCDRVCFTFVCTNKRTCFNAFHLSLAHLKNPPPLKPTLTRIAVATETTRFFCLHDVPKGTIELRNGSATNDGCAARTSEARKLQHYARPGHVSFDERSFKLTTLAVESFGRLGDEGYFSYLNVQYERLRGVYRPNVRDLAPPCVLSQKVTGFLN